MSAILVAEGQMAADKTLMHISMEPARLARLDDFRFEHRFPSRAAALKWLLDAALNAGLKPKDRQN